MKVQKLELKETHKFHGIPGHYKKRRFNLEISLSDMSVHEATVFLMRLGSVLVKNTKDREGALEVAKAQLKVIGVEVTDKAFHAEV